MLTVNELFAGIGSQSAALERLGIDFKVVGIAEIDKYAIKSYEAIHGPVRNYGDISKIEKLDYADFWTYSFPCQDISVAGKQAGIEKGKTRSGLLYEVERLLEKSKECGELPKYLMLENVKNLVGKKFKAQFDEWLQRLDELGFNTYWQVLNAKNYGVPQNRERVFGISIRKDIDTGYVFPEPFELKIRLKDILENEVDEKYYINNDKANKLINKLNDTNQLADIVNPCDGTINEPKVKDISNCIKARYDCGVSNQRSDGTMVVENKRPIRLGNIYGEQFGGSFGGNVWDKNGIAPTLKTTSAASQQHIITKLETVKVRQATKKGYIECNVPGVADLSFPDSKTRRGRVQENGEICPTLMSGQQDICYIDTPCIAASRGRNPDNPSDRTVGSPTEQRLEINQNGTSNTITTVQKDNYVVEPSGVYTNASERFQRGPLQGLSRCLKSENHDAGTTTTDFRIRKLTPLECYRLMGFTDNQFYKAAEVNSNSQLYKQAGNSIVVDVLYYLFKNLFIDKPIMKKINIQEELPGQLSIFDL